VLKRTIHTILQPILENRTYRSRITTASLLETTIITRFQRTIRPEHKCSHNSSYLLGARIDVDFSHIAKASLPLILLFPTEDLNFPTNSPFASEIAIQFLSSCLLRVQKATKIPRISFKSAFWSISPLDIDHIAMQSPKGANKLPYLFLLCNRKPLPPILSQVRPSYDLDQHFLERIRVAELALIQSFVPGVLNYPGNTLLGSEIARSVLSSPYSENGRYNTYQPQTRPLEHTFSP